MSIIAASALLLAPPTTGADFTEVETPDEAAIAAAVEADAGADFAVTDGDVETEAEEKADPDHPEAKLYDASIDASAAVDEALARAAVSMRNVLIVLGANWCHDSRAFAGWTESERIGGLIKDRFELVFVNVGMPQTDDGHNQHIARRFGFNEQEGTPLVIMTSYDGIVLNRETAQSWRNTASRSEDEIYEELLQLSKASG